MEEPKDFLKSINELSFGEDVELKTPNGDEYTWLRVPGGWIVTQIKPDTSVFVPYSDEGTT